jgi:exonuclease VII large subunit
MDSNVPSITNLLEELENIIEESRAVPFSRNISVDKDTIMDIIADMRANLPNQLKQAEKIVSNCNKTVNEANNQAKMIIEQAKAQAKQLTLDHEITRLANEEAANIINSANEEAKSLRIGATEYVKDLFERSETVINESLEAFTSQSVQVQRFLTGEIDIIFKVRQELMGKSDSNTNNYPPEPEEYDEDME